jgi:hypothetical protein
MGYNSYKTISNRRIFEYIAPDLKTFIADQAGTPWKELFTRQLTPIHITAFFLHLKNWDHKMNEHEL